MRTWIIVRRDALGFFFWMGPGGAYSNRRSSAWQFDAEKEACDTLETIKASSLPDATYKVEVFQR